MLDRAQTRFSTPVKVLLLLVAAFAVVSSPAEARSRHHRGNGARHYAMPAGATDPEKDAALIVDGETGKILYSRNAAAQRHPASLTKMMTLYLLFDALKKGQVTLSTSLPVSAHAASQRPTKLHLYAGDTLPVDMAIYAIVVRSANDVAVTVAEALGGTEGHFAEMMNVKARQLGMRDTFYHNASGLPDPLQISTASDLAILARHLAYDFPQYYHYFGAPGFSYRGVAYQTHDNLIGRYEGADGIKTGYTEASGFNLVSSVVRGRTHIIGVVMGGRTAHRRDNEMMRLLDNTFAQIGQNPALVASARVPWQNVAQNTQSVVAGFDLTPPSSRPAQTQPVQVADAEDEDAAEARGEEADVEQPEVNVIAPPPAPVPAPPPVRRAPPPPPAQTMAASLNVPTPTPRPKHDVVLASYQPNTAKLPIPKPTAKRETGEGDYGDDLASAAKRLTASDWTIQIGAFADSNLARAQLASYAERSMDILGQAARIVVPFRGVDGQMLFRARFGPFVEREAREVCTRLTERGQTCFAALSTR